MKRYFYTTIHFSPEYENTVLKKYRDDLYIDTHTEEIYRKRLLYDFGWGQESGYELLPELSFTDLITLVEQPPPVLKKKFFQRYTNEQIEPRLIWWSNFYGSVSVIMQDHLGEFIDFLSSKVNTDYFSDPVIRENFKCFAFNSQKAISEGQSPGGILTRSYEDVFDDCPQWKNISAKVISQIYG